MSSQYESILKNIFVYENSIKHFRNVVTTLCPVCADSSFYFLREDPVDVLLSEAHNNLIVVSRYAKEHAQHSLRALTWNVVQIE